MEYPKPIVIYMYMILANDLQMYAHHDKSISKIPKIVEGYSKRFISIFLIHRHCSVSYDRDEDVRIDLYEIVNVIGRSYTSP